MVPYQGSPYNGMTNGKATSRNPRLFRIQDIYLTGTKGELCQSEWLNKDLSLINSIQI